MKKSRSIRFEIFSALHDVQRAYGGVFNMALHVKGLLFEIVPAAAAQTLRVQLGNYLRADILDHLRFKHLSALVVIAREQKFKRVGKLSEIFKPTHAAQQPFVIRRVTAV